MTTPGIPLSSKATRVMLLGSGEIGKEVLIEAERPHLVVPGSNPSRRRCSRSWKRPAP